MGQYTFLRADVKIRPDAVKLIETLFSDQRRWQAVFDLDTRFNELSLDSRAGFIPFGGVDTESKPTFDGTTLRFYCSLKNYEKTIEKFLMVAPLLVLEGTIDTAYETEWHRDLWHHYKFSPGPDGLTVMEDLGTDPEPEDVHGFMF